MNQEHRNCESVAERDPNTETGNAAPVRFVQPAWQARKHENGVDLEVTLPGVRKEDLNLEVTGSQLQLDARRHAAEDRGRLIYGEAAPEAYRLKLRLGESLNGGALEARLADGILRVAIPLVESAQPRRIEIV